MADAVRRLFDLLPSEAFALFQTPAYSYPTVGGTAQQVLSTDIYRFVVGFTAGSQFLVSTDPAMNSSGQQGFTVPGNAINPPFILAYWQYGPLINSAWYAVTTAPEQITVLSLSLQPWVTATDLLATPRLRPVRPPPPRVTTATGVNGDAGLVSYWRRLLDAVRGK